MFARKKRTLAALLAVFMLMSLWTGPGYAVRDGDSPAVVAEAEDAGEEAAAELAAGEEASSSEEETGGEEDDSPSGGGVIYVTPTENLADAFRDCEPDSKMTVLLAEDMTFSDTVTVTEGQNITLDLNGNTLTYAPDESASTERRAGIQVEGGTFTLKSEERGGTLASEADQVALLSLRDGETTVERMVLTVEGTNSVCIEAEQKDDENAYGKLYLNGSALAGTACALEAKDYRIEITEDSVLQASGAEEVAVIRVEDTQLYIWDTQVTGIAEGERGSVIGIEAKNSAPDNSFSHGIMLYNDTHVDVRGAAATGVRLTLVDFSLARDEDDGPGPVVTVQADETAVGITAYAGSVGLGNSTVEVTGRSAAGVVYDRAEEPAFAVSTVDVSITATGTEEATGLRASNSSVWMAGKTEITAAAPKAVGIQAIGGTVFSVNEDTLITADAGAAARGSAIAVQVHALAELDPEKMPPLMWESGSAKASAANADSAFAVAVEYPADITADRRAQAVIDSEAGSFYGRVCVLRNGEQVTDSGLLTILGGTYSVEPDAGDIAEGYAAERSGGAWQVAPAQAAMVIFEVGEQVTRTPYASFEEAWNKAGSGRVIRLYRNVQLEETLEVPAGKLVILELNGATISPAEDRELTLFRVEGRLYIQANSTTSSVGDALIYGGTLTGGNNPASAGAVLVTGADAEFVMEGGTITGNSGRAGGIEAADGAQVTLRHTEVTENTGTEAGGILAGADTEVRLEEECKLTNNTGTSSGAAGGILMREGTLALNGVALGDNKGLGVGGIAAYGGSVTLTNSTIRDNSGGRTGGVLLEGTAAEFTGTAEDFFARTEIEYNDGGITGGVEVASNSGSLAVTGAVEIRSNSGGCPMDAETLEADTENVTPMNLILRYDGEDGARSVTLRDAYDADSGEEQMQVSVGAVRVARPGEVVSQKGVELFKIPDSAGESGTVYAIEAAVTGLDTPEVKEDGWPYLSGDHTFFYDDYELVREENGGYALKFTESTPELEDYTGKTVILHSNDVHGQIMGYAAIASLRTDFEEKGADVLLVDVGDFSQGDPTVSLSKGESAIELMNAAGYDVATLGNHEFDFGYEQLTSNTAKADFPIICADVLKDGKPIYDPTWTYTGESGLKIGFFGLETPETQTKVNPGLIQGLQFHSKGDLYKCAQEQIVSLKNEGVDIIIGLTHLGVDEESALDGHRSIDVYNQNLALNIDMLLDGHSHTVMTEGEDGEPIQSTGTKFANVGVVVIDNESKTIEDNYLIPVSTWDEKGNFVSWDVELDPEVAAKAQAIIDQVDEKYGTVFARSEVLLNGEKAPGNRTEETNLGDLITDAMVWKVLTDGGTLTTGGKAVDEDHIVGITNGGGIRAAIKAGDVTRKDLNTVLPFGNTIAVVYVNGAELLEALEASTYATPEALGGYPQTCGIEFTLNTAKTFDQGEAYPNSTYYKPASIQRVTITEINNKPFSLTDTYAVVTNNFCAAGGDTYYAFKNASDQFDTGIVMDEAVMEYVETKLNGVIGVGYETPRGDQTILTKSTPDDQPNTPDTPTPNKHGCYVATAVYGSYDCPEVWTLRRFRDETLGSTWYGRLFIKAYYAVSPTAVELFGDCDWFQNFFRSRLDQMVSELQAQGVASAPYEDLNW